MAGFGLGFSPSTSNAQFSVLSRLSEMEFNSTNMGGVNNFVDMTTSGVFDAQFFDSAMHIEPGGDINDGIWFASQYSTTNSDIIQADLHSEVLLAQAAGDGSGILDIRNIFEVEFQVSQITPIELGGTLFGSIDIGTQDFVRVRFQEFNGIVFLNLFVTDDLSDFDSPFVTTLQPGTTYRLLVESHADVLSQGATLSEVSVCLRSQVVLGDVNGDGLVNLLDVTPFIDAISSGQYMSEADTNCDGLVNLLDVETFIDLISS